MRINKLDNVEVDLSNGHKYALTDIKKGEQVIKYGNPIGYATSDIRKGEHVHTHNLATALGESVSYSYDGEPPEMPITDGGRTFMGYVRRDGSVGIRNDIYIVNTVACVNGTAQTLARLTGALAFTHPYGCSQLGEDQEITQKILCGLIKHPNAAGVLVLGLGCENNNIEAMKKHLGKYDPDRVKFLVCQEVEDEISEGIRLIDELKQYASSFKRTEVNISHLCIGLKCGGSDGYSGITANPLVGRFADKIISVGGSCILTEVPEMFGAEHLLMKRCVNRTVFDKTVKLICDFKEYYTSHGQEIYENPSPGNKKGGITTLEEKSLGCVQKAGSSTVTDVLDYGDRVVGEGLFLLNGPGNDPVAITNLTAAGAHLILFTTGRGTPLGAPVPTVKISTNADLAARKSAWIDFDASPILNGAELDDEFFNYVMEVASGRETKNEQYGFREIAIFKDGVTL